MQMLPELRLIAAVMNVAPLVLRKSVASCTLNQQHVIVYEIKRARISVSNCEQRNALGLIQLTRTGIAGCLCTVLEARLCCVTSNPQSTFPVIPSLRFLI